MVIALHGSRLDVDVDELETHTIVTLAGVADLRSTAQLRKLELMLNRGNRLVLHVSGLAEFDSTFFRFLANVLRRDADRRATCVEIVGAKAPLRRALEVTGLARRLLA